MFNFNWHHIETVAKYWGSVLPLDIFVFIGSFLEEIIPPIPAPLVMTTAGSLAVSQHHTLWYLLWLALSGAAGKTIADLIFYKLGDKLEDTVTKKFGWFIGVKHEDLENIGKRFTGGWKDILFILIMRVLPFGPTVSLSVLCGVIRVNLTSFIVATVTGLIIRDLMYLYTGYAGVALFLSFMKEWHKYHVLLSWALFFAMVGLVWWLYRRSQTKQNGNTSSPSA